MQSVAIESMRLKTSFASFLAPPTLFPPVVTETDGPLIKIKILQRRVRRVHFPRKTRAA